MPAGIIPGRPRISSFPYVSGDTFREYADIIFDEDIKTFNPQKVHNGSVIFVKRDFIDYFISNCHPFINHPYILITHNSDYDVSESYKSYLDDEKLIVWFAQNVNYVHPKLIPIPIGFANRYLTHGDIHAINAAQALLHHTKVIKNKMLYLNFNIQYFSQERRKIFEQLQQKSFSYSCSPKPFQDYLIDIVQSYFVASPRGNGIDCHRTWEALTMGSIPIVESSSLDPLFEDLPVLIIKDWSSITEEYLQEQLKIMEHKEYKFEKIFAQYWFDLIDSYKSHI
jgi:hypothetical protein